jgi:Ni/Fe-hydrogenase subunit HybB-like protein
MITANTGTASAGSSQRSIPVLLWVLTIVFLVGLVSFVYGLSSTAMRPDFALFTTTLLYLMGVSQAGVVFCAITRLVHAQWAKPYYRLAELSTLAFFPFAMLGFLAIYCYGRDELFYWLNPPRDAHLSPWLDIDWLLARNLFGLLLFYGLSAVYAARALQPDLATGSTAVIDHRRRERQLYCLSPFVIIGFIVCNTLLGWDFAMMLRPHWHSTVFPIIFWFGSLYAGTAALIAFPAVLGCSRDAGSAFGPGQVYKLGMLINGFTLMWLYFFWAQFFVIWFGNLPHETEPEWRQMQGHYGLYYWLMMAACFFVPFIGFLFAIIKRSLAAICVIALGINCGIWLQKYLMIVPVFAADDRPFDRWLDVSLSVGMLAGFLALLLFLGARLPRYSHWEISLKPERRP